MKKLSIVSFKETVNIVKNNHITHFKLFIKKIKTWTIIFLMGEGDHLRISYILTCKLTKFYISFLRGKKIC